MAQSGNYREAFEAFNKAVELNPRNAKAYNGRGNMYWTQQLYDRATENYNKAIELDPKFFEAYINRGNTYSRTHSFDKAIDDYTQAIEINPVFARHTQTVDSLSQGNSSTA